MERIIGAPDRQAPALSVLWPFYVVIFVGFVGYSLMITVFTPMLLRGDGGSAYRSCWRISGLPAFSRPACRSGC